MKTIRIKNIGPIQDTGTLTLSEVNVFIGPQSSGKSTIMKVLCFCCWVEKYCITNSNLKEYAQYQRFFKTLKNFHHFPDSFFASDSEIDFRGDWLDIHFSYEGRKNAVITSHSNIDEALNTKLCFIPAERTLISAVKNIDSVYRVRSIDNVFNYIAEWDEVKRHYNKDHSLIMPFLENLEFFYDSKNGKEILKLSTGKEFSPHVASSGVQSSYSLYAMVCYLTDQVFNQNKSFSNKYLQSMVIELLRQEKISSEDQLIEKQNQIAARVARKIQYKSSQIFIEEPEQNLYPLAQYHLIRAIVGKIHNAGKTGRKSMLCLTTHSPYIITVLNALIFASWVKQQKQESQMDSVIPANEVLPISEVSAYYIGNGTALNLIPERTEDDIPAIDASILDSASDEVDKLIDQLIDFKES